MPRTPADLLYGTLDLLILKTLSWKPMHGYAIAVWLDERSRGKLGIDDAALYKALHRLEEQGAIASDWRITENNRRARFYTLTSAGRRLLKAERVAWQDYASTVMRVLRTV